MSCRPFFPAWRLAAGLLALLSACIDPFRPEVQDVSTNFLVVDGFLNADGVTTIRLSRSFSVKTAGTPPAETRARVYLEDDQGGQQALTETAPGTYASVARRLDAARRYRLHLYTAAGSEYASDYTAVRPTPPIDEVSWRPTADGLRLSVSTHDAAGQTRYYRWSYDETWEFTSAYPSSVEYVGGRMQARTVDIYRCWASRPATAIRLSSTARLSQDVVADFPLLTLPSTASELRIKYSILVRQYAQTAEEFAYWDLLRKNTESIGGLFDPQPAQLTGNVRCLSDPSAVALGYVGAYSVAEKRIFVSRNELPQDWQIYNTNYSQCGLDTVPLTRLGIEFSSGALLPVAPVSVNGMLIGYSAASTPCVDCRLRGSNMRPSFWP